MSLRRNTPTQTEKPPKSRLRWIYRLVIMGGVFYVVLFHLPFARLKITVANSASASSVKEASSPLIRDENGMPIHQSTIEKKIGYDIAKKDGITTHAACKQLQNVYHASGCQDYVTEQKHIPPHVRQGAWDSGKTTEQCLAEVNAYYEPLIQDTYERGDTRAAQSWTTRNWQPELKECKNYDNIRIGTVVHAPALRLQNILNRVRQGGTITPEEQLIVNNDLIGVLHFPDHPAKSAYLANYETYSRIVSGKR